MSTSQPDFDRMNLADAQNFGLLYDHYAPILWRHVLLRTRSADDADEIVSKTFLKTWEYVRTRRRVRNVRSFLWTAANRMLVDFYRANSRARARFADFSLAEENHPVVIPAIDEQLDFKGEAAEVVNALRVLNSEEAMLLTLRFVEELSLEEVAAIYGRSKNATAVAIHRALKRLRQVLRTNNSAILINPPQSA
jgi:RNA polymerase sigma-70 factor (ECF subfamily)